MGSDPVRPSVSSEKCFSDLQNRQLAYSYSPNIQHLYLQKEKKKKRKVFHVQIPSAFGL